MRWRDGLAFACLTLLVGVLYSHTLKVPFVFDDRQNIQGTSQIRLTTLSLPSLIRAGLSGYLSRRPIANISFALNYYVHQYRVQGYHVVKSSFTSPPASCSIWWCALPCASRGCCPLRPRRRPWRFALPSCGSCTRCTSSPSPILSNA